jgi:hypothetical protein
MKANKEQLYMVFDVESVGLHGEGFAVGFVVVNGYGIEVQHGLMCCPQGAARSAVADATEAREWLAKNIPPMATTHYYPEQIRDAFWRQWVCWKERGAILVADCAWPVEARFLRNCVADDMEGREWQGPYPLHDLASILLATGKNPLEKFGRNENELPEHNPLMDARQSARILCGALVPSNDGRQRRLAAPNC